jgi:hypothetical protein
LTCLLCDVPASEGICRRGTEYSSCRLFSSRLPCLCYGVNCDKCHSIVFNVNKGFAFTQVYNFHIIKIKQYYNNQMVLQHLERFIICSKVLHYFKWFTEQRFYNSFPTLQKGLNNIRKCFAISSNCFTIQTYILKCLTTFRKSFTIFAKAKVQYLHFIFQNSQRFNKT